MDYTQLEDRCTSENLGKELIDLEETFGYLIIPENQTVEYTTEVLKINGPTGLFGKSLLFKNLDTGRSICASLSMVDKNQEKIAVARFSAPVAGNVYFRWFSTQNNHTDMLISTDLYLVQNKENITKFVKHTEHRWKIYVTDILESDNDRHQDNCNVLQLIFDPDNKGEGKALGDIDSRLGKVKVSRNYNTNKYKTLYNDDSLILLPSDLTGPQRRLYLVLFESKHEDVFLACAKIRYDQPVNAR